MAYIIMAYIVMAQVVMTFRDMPYIVCSIRYTSTTNPTGLAHVCMQVCTTICRHADSHYTHIYTHVDAHAHRYMPTQLSVRM